ncbi:MAG: hypothetical protein OEV64_10375 [Desulfobulbaceae bacterium]|nr:hypothetical protein [Desulfobulbaceae bacterium]
MRMKDGFIKIIFAFSIILVTATAYAAKPTTLMYVANEGDNNVMVVDLSTEQIIATIPTGKVPHAIVFAAGNAYVNNRGSKFLTVIDTKTLEAVGVIPLQAISFQLALSPDGELLAVSYKDALMVSIIDVASNVILATVPLGETPEGGFPENPMKHPHWSKDGKFLYVQNNIEKTIVKIEAETFAIAAEIPMPGSNHDLVPSANDKIIYAVNQDTNSGTSLTVIDAENDKVINDITVPLLPGETGYGHHGDLTPNGKTFYFCNEGGNSVTLIDTTSMQVIKSLVVGWGAGHPVFSNDNQKVFIVPHKDNVISVIDVATQEVVANITAGVGKNFAHSSYVTNDGKYLYVLNVNDKKLVKIDTVSLSVVSTIPVGTKALAFGITSAQL